MPRCCTPLSLEPCYASVLVAGGAACLRGAVEALEAAPLCPCVSAWCPRCERVALLAAPCLLAQFPCHSAYVAHQIVARERIEATLLADALRE